MTVRRRAKTRDRTGGYLLVEALVTLALAALILGGLLSISGLLLRSGDRAAAVAEGLESDRRAIAAMSDEIRRLARLRWSGKDAGFVFLGAPDRLVFALLAVQANGLRAPVAVAYQATPDALLRAEGEIPPGAAGLSDVALAPPQRIDPGAGSLRFAFVRREKAGAETLEEAWERDDELPAAIVVERRPLDGGAAIETFRLALITQAEPGCAAPAKAPCSLVKRKKGEAGSEAGARDGEDRGSTPSGPEPEGQTR